MDAIRTNRNTGNLTVRTYSIIVASYGTAFEYNGCRKKIARIIIDAIQWMIANVGFDLIAAPLHIIRLAAALERIAAFNFNRNLES